MAKPPPQENGQAGGYGLGQAFPGAEAGKTSQDPYCLAPAWPTNDRRPRLCQTCLPPFLSGHSPQSATCAAGAPGTPLQYAFGCYTGIPPTWLVPLMSSTEQCTRVGAPAPIAVSSAVHDCRINKPRNLNAGLRVAQQSTGFSLPPVPSSVLWTLRGNPMVSWNYVTAVEGPAQQEIKHWWRCRINSWPASQPMTDGWGKQILAARAWQTTGGLLPRTIRLTNGISEAALYRSCHWPSAAGTIKPSARRRS